MYTCLYSQVQYTLWLRWTHGPVVAVQISHSIVVGLNPETNCFFLLVTVFSAALLGHSLANVFGLSFCFALDLFW